MRPLEGDACDGVLFFRTGGRYGVILLPLEHGSDTLAVRLDHDDVKVMPDEKPFLDARHGHVRTARKLS